MIFWKIFLIFIKKFGFSGKILAYQGIFTYNRAFCRFGPLMLPIARLEIHRSRLSHFCRYQKPKWKNNFQIFIKLIKNSRLCLGNFDFFIFT